MFPGSTLTIMGEKEQRCTIWSLLRIDCLCRRAGSEAMILGEDNRRQQDLLQALLASNGESGNMGSGKLIQGHNSVAQVPLTPKLLQINSTETFLCNGGHYTNSIITPGILLCNRLAIARLNYTQEPPYITQTNSPENIFEYVMDSISQINSVENTFVYAIILVLPVIAAKTTITDTVLQQYLLHQ